jgi:hypothetical protein
MDEVVEKFHEVLDLACRSSLKILPSARTAPEHKSIPWWSKELTILRKKGKCAATQVPKNKRQRAVAGTAKSTILSC